MRFHDLRHLHATMAILAGVPVNVVSMRLGHADVRMTLAAYVEPDALSDVAAAQTIDGLCFSAP